MGNIIIQEGDKNLGFWRGKAADLFFGVSDYGIWEKGWLDDLTARGKLEKNMSMVLERNLIGLENSDLPYIIASFSTNRRNPFAASVLLTK